MRVDHEQKSRVVTADTNCSEKSIMNETTELLSGRRRLLKRKNWIYVAIVAFIAVFGLFTYKLANESTRPQPVGPLARVARIPDGRRVSAGSDKRLVIVGDVHGMHKEFDKLLRKLDFDPAKDQLVLLGDFTTKGPDSLKVIDDAIKYNAYCVRGNHEDEILGLYADYHRLKAPKTFPPYASVATMIAGEEATPTLAPTAAARPTPTEIGIEEDLGRDMPLVKHLKPHHIRFIERCSAMLELGPVSDSGVSAVAVHGGLMWDEHDLEKQDIWAVLRVRSVIGEKWEIPTEESDVGRNWFDLWNEEQKTRPKNERYEVIYGHDASKGLQLHKYTKGLDSRCQRGGELSAMVISMNKKGEYKQKLHQQNC